MYKFVLTILFIGLTGSLFGFLFDARANLADFIKHHEMDSVISLVYNLALSIVLIISDVCTLLLFIISSLHDLYDNKPKKADLIEQFT